MRRALRWLWRSFCTVALGGAILLGALAWLLAAPAPAQAAVPVAVRAFVAANEQSSGAEPTPQERARAKQRATESRLLFLASTLFEGALVVGFLLLGGTRWLVRLTERFGGRWLPALGVAVGVLTLASAVLTFPLDVYSSFTFQHKYGLSNQTFPQWLRDYGVEQGVSLALGLPLLVGLYALLRRAPRTWWLWLAGLSAPVSIFLMLIYPVFISPLFNTFTSLQDETLRQDILAMAHAQGIAAHDVYQMDASRQSNAINAYVVGFGPTHRIVLYDTLLQRFTPAEIKFVMAHEMGHYVLGHVTQGILFSILGALAGGFLLYRLTGYLLARHGDFFGFTSLGHPASYPLLIALSMGLSLLAMPLSNAVSRHMEWQADRFAVRTYPHPDAGIAAFHKLARYNVAEEDPPAWVEFLFSSHPSLQRRIAYLERVQGARE